MLIKGKRVYLDPMEDSDAPVVHQWLNEFEVQRLGLMEHGWPADLKQSLAWIQGLNSSSHSRLLAVKRLAEQDLIGCITVRKLSQVSRSLRFGSMIWPPELWNQGLGSEARKIFLDYVFNQLGFRRVFGEFAAFNLASRKSHEKLGAHISVQAKEAAFVDAQFHDLLHYTYHREDFYSAYAPELSNQITETGPDCLSRDYDRLLQDYFNLPGIGNNPLPEAGWADRPSISCKSGRAVLLINPQRKNADLVFAPVNQKELGRDLIRKACVEGFDQLNLHRLQVCLPISATTWRQELGAAGFSEEGQLNGVCFANGRYFDLVFLGRLRGGNS